MMTNKIILPILVLSMAFVSCKKDEQPAPDLSGDYTFKSATLIDGNVLDLTSTDLVVLNAASDPDANPVNSLTIKKDESVNTTQLVDLVLALIAPCTEPSLNARDYAINFNSDGALTFICASEKDKSEVVGSWQLENDNNTLSLIFSDGAISNLPPVKLKNAKFVDNKIEGIIESFPVFKDLDGSADDYLNYQLISFSIVLIK